MWAWRGCSWRMSAAGGNRGCGEVLHLTITATVETLLGLAGAPAADCDSWITRVLLNEETTGRTTWPEARRDATRTAMRAGGFPTPAGPVTIMTGESPVPEARARADIAVVIVRHPGRCREGEQLQRNAADNDQRDRRARRSPRHQPGGQREQCPQGADQREQGPSGLVWHAGVQRRDGLGRQRQPRRAGQRTPMRPVHAGHRATVGGHPTGSDRGRHHLVRCAGLRSGGGLR
jgi:hypothetical protein